MIWTARRKRLFSSSGSDSTSLSPYSTRPCEGSSRPAVIRPVVDFPHPLSPTRHRVWPGSMVNDTSSTALTRSLPEPYERPACSSLMGVPLVALTSLRFPIGTYLLPVPACGRLPWSNLYQRRVLLAALVRGVRTSRVKLAARRKAYQVGRGAWDRAQLLLSPGQGRHRIQKADCVRVARVVEDLLDFPELDDAAGVSRGHPVSQLGGQRKVVGDEDHGEAVLVFQVPQHLDNGPLSEYVQRGGWFVQYQNQRVQKEAERDHDPLAHTAGELVREGSEHPIRIQLHHLQALRGSFREGTALERPVGLAVVLCGVGKVVADAHYRVECVQGRLEHHRALTPAEAPEILVVEGRQVQRLFRGGTEDDLAPCDRGVLRQQTHQGEPEGRLARAALAYEGQALVMPEVEANPAHRPHQSPSRRVAYLQITHAQNVVAAFHPLKTPAAAAGRRPPRASGSWPRDRVETGLWRRSET